MSSKLPFKPVPVGAGAPTSWGLVRGAAEPATANLTDLASLFAAFDQHLATLPLAEQLAEAGRWLAALTDLYCSRADCLLTAWQNKHHPTEPVITDTLDDLFTQSQSFDLADLFEEPDPHYYPADRATPTSQVGVVDKADLLDWIDTQAEDFPEVLEIPEDEDPTAWMQALREFWQRHPDQNVSWHDLCLATELPPAATFLALLLGGYPHQREPGTDFYDPTGIWVQPLTVPVVGGPGED
jgi:hypothetical protein